MKSQGTSLWAETPHKTEGKSFTRGAGTHPWSPNTTQVENSISVKKYLPTGKTLSTVCFKTKGEESRERTVGTAPRSRRNPPICSSRLLQAVHAAAAQSRASEGLPGAPACSTASFCFICLQVSNFLFLPQVCKTLSSTKGPFPSLPPEASYHLLGFQAECRDESVVSNVQHGAHTAKAL